MQQFHDLINGAFVDIYFGHHFETFVTFGGELRFHARRVLGSSHEHDAFLELGLAVGALVAPVQEFFGDEYQDETDNARQNNDGTVQFLHVDQEEHDNDPEGHEDRTLEEEPSGHRPRTEQGSSIKPLELKHQRDPRYNNDVEQRETAERLKGPAFEDVQVQAGAEKIRDPQTQGEERGVLDLIQLSSELAVAAQHRLLIFCHLRTRRRL